MEIPGTVDLWQHARISCVALKSHEDSLSCMDVLVGIDAGIRAAFAGCALAVQNFLNDRAWSFLYANRAYIEKHQGAAIEGSISTLHQSVGAQAHIPSLRRAESHADFNVVPVVRSEPHIDHPIVPSRAANEIKPAQGTCWAHVSRAVRKKETLMNQPETFPEFMHGIREIHDISDKGVAQVQPILTT